MKFRFFFIGLFFVSFGLLAEDGNAPQITFNSPNTYYSGRDTEIDLKLSQKHASQLYWRLSYLGRTIANGKLEPKENDSCKIKFPFPELAPGITAATVFTCTEESVSEPVLTKELYFYHPNPFINTSKYFSAEEQKLTLWDPSNNGMLKKLLLASNVPFLSISSLQEFDGKILLISGIDFDNFSGIDEDLLKIASASTVKIVIMPPLKGSFRFKAGSCDGIILAGNNILHQFSKKFDTAIWGSVKVPQLGLAFSGSEDIITLTPSDKQQEKKFSFCQINIGESRIYICAWDIAGLSEKSPTPLYLLSNLILQNNNK